MKNVNFKTLLVTIIISMGMLTTGVYADRDRHEHDTRYKKQPKDFHYDKRYHHDRYYPKYGFRYKALPSHHYRVHHHDHYFYFSAGIWYQLSGGSYIVVRPPIGIVVPILPPYYTTVWFYGVPYYYANEVYYVWRPDVNGYVVSEPPAETSRDPVPLSDQLFVYPKQGQSEQQQADDRYACHRWGVEQTGYDPTRPPQDKNVDELNRNRADYQRAMKACLEGRGYSVR